MERLINSGNLMDCIDIEAAPQQIDFGDIAGNVGNGTANWPGMNGEAYRPFEEMQNQTGTLPGMSYGSAFLEQGQNATFRPPSLDDYTNATIPSGSGYVDRFQEQTGAINNQTAQYQGCMPGTGNGDKEEIKD